MDYQSVLDQLVACSGSNAFPLVSAGAQFRYIDGGLPEFVGPDLEPCRGVDQHSAPKVLIISAAGAVGKSTLANQIAFEKHAPIWDLAQSDAVGQNSLIGQITASFGFQLAGQVSSGLQNGTLFLVIDALDEARVKANEAGFEAFIKDIAQFANTTVGTSFVLCCRTQTAENTWLLLSEAKVPTNLMTIEPFTRNQAERYIEARIRHLSESARNRISNHKQSFVEARDLIFQLLEKAVGGETGADQESVREFMGYAPVLETVAVLLGEEGNYQDLIGDLKSVDHSETDSEYRPLSVLEHVVNRLLERERKQKLQHNIRPALEEIACQSNWADWDVLYSAEEQRYRLLGHILDLKFKTSPEMPPAMLAIYEERIATWLPEHPFLRDGKVAANKVFESYLFAFAMREYLLEMSKQVERKIASAEYRPSRLLADFYILLGEQRGERTIAARQIGLLYEALLAGETDRLQIRLSVDAGDPDEEEEGGEAGSEQDGAFELVYATPDGNDDERNVIRRFQIVQADDVITFGRQLKDASITTRGHVALGGMSDDFEIGPDVDIRCGQLTILSSGLVVRTAARSDKQGPVQLDARKCDSVITKRPVVRGQLHVCWPGDESYPWNEYATPTQENDDEPRMQQVHKRFRRIVLSLRSHSKGSLARLCDKINHRRVLKGEVGQALLQQLLDDGILVIKKNFYHWEPEPASRLLNVSWHDLRNRRTSPELRAYFGEFIRNNENLFQ